MSDRLCNKCLLEHYKKEYGVNLEIRYQKDELNKCTWTVVSVHGRELAQLMKVSKECAC